MGVSLERKMILLLLPLFWLSSAEVQSGQCTVEANNCQQGAASRLKRTSLIQLPFDRIEKAWAEEEVRQEEREREVVAAMTGVAGEHRAAPTLVQQQQEKAPEPAAVAAAALQQQQAASSSSSVKSSAPLVAAGVPLHHEEALAAGGTALDQQAAKLKRRASLFAAAAAGPDGVETAVLLEEFIAQTSRLSGSTMLTFGVLGFICLAIGYFFFGAPKAQQAEDGEYSSLPDDKAGEASPLTRGEPITLGPASPSPFATGPYSGDGNPFANLQETPTMAGGGPALRAASPGRTPTNEPCC